MTWHGLLPDDERWTREVRVEDAQYRAIIAELAQLRAELAQLRAVVAADLDQADAWAALGVVAAVTKTRLTPREETSLAQLQDAARQRVVTTTRKHAEALAQWRKENDQ